jgi:hypothetical protein
LSLGPGEALICFVGAKISPLGPGEDACGFATSPPSFAISNLVKNRPSEIASTKPYTPPLPQPVPAGKPTFTDYIRGGCEINLNVAIDFTGSNGDPRKPGTLHYFHPDGLLNDYEKAIRSIGTILAKYDSDEKFPVMGFGAKYDGIVRHHFQCGGEEEVHGVDGILDAYRQTFASGLVMVSYPKACFHFNSCPMSFFD